MPDEHTPEPERAVLRVEVWGAVGRRRSSTPPPRLELVTVGEPEDFGDTKHWEGKAKAAYAAQAERMVGAMARTLPGGLIDALLVELLDCKRSLLIVPYVEEPMLAPVPNNHPAQTVPPAAPYGEPNQIGERQYFNEGFDEKGKQHQSPG